MNQDREKLDLLSHWVNCYGHTKELDDFVDWVYEQYGMVPPQRPVDPQ